jgi:fructose-1,6-bisphosphatase/inositol monophosphatase family enzyme
VSILDREILALMRDVTARVIMPRFRNLPAGEVVDKGGNDPVTIADREAEAMLFEGLAKLAPGLGLVGEEAVHADPAVAALLGGPCWIVDPVDGTRNFAAGEGPFGIIVAQAEGGVPVSGWIFDCQSERFCAAHLGGGAFVDGERITARTTGEEPPVAAISLLFANQAERAALLEHIGPHYRLADIPYCAAEQYPRLALGVNDVSLFNRTLAWDHAAGTLWLNEAGGHAARFDGSPYRVNQPERTGLIGAASPALFDTIAKRMATLPAI